MTQTIKISGTEQRWNLSDIPNEGQSCIVINSNYGTMRTIVKPFYFSAQEGNGEQRQAKKARVRKLKKAIEKNKLTQTAWYAGIRPEHTIVRKDGRVEIEIDPENPLPLTDGNHRREALEELRAQGGNILRKIDNLPITCIVHLDPDKTQINFINLQDVFTVDSGQLLTMKITSNEVAANQQVHYNSALEIAKTLHTNSSSHLYRLVKFDTKSGGSLAFKALAQSGKSDLSTSLFGTAIIARDYEKDDEWAASMILFAYESLQKDAPELLKRHKILAPEPDGTIGGSTMIIGLGNMLAARMKMVDREFPSDADDKWFIKCAKEVFAGEEVGGNFSNQRKRQLMNAFCVEYFRDLIEDEDSVVGAHEGVPISLCLLLGTSTFNVTKFAKPKAKKGRKKKVVKASEATEEIVPTEPEHTISVEDVDDNKIIESDTDPAWNDEEADFDDDVEDDDGLPWNEDEDEDIF